MPIPAKTGMHRVRRAGPIHRPRRDEEAVSKPFPTTQRGTSPGLHGRCAPEVDSGRTGRNLHSFASLEDKLCPGMKIGHDFIHRCAHRGMDDSPPPSYLT